MKGTLFLSSTMCLTGTPPPVISARNDGTPARRSPPSLHKQSETSSRRMHHSKHTRNAYWRWIRRFIRFHGTVHPRPRRLDAQHVRAFLNHLAVKRNVAASTQNQALSAILFLYRIVLRCHLSPIEEIQRPRRPKRLPVVLSKQEVTNLLKAMSGVNRLVAKLLYGYCRINHGHQTTCGYISDGRYHDVCTKWTYGCQIILTSV